MIDKLAGGLNLSIQRNQYSMLDQNQTKAEGAASFKDMLSNSIAEADRLYGVTQVDTQALLSGNVDNLAQVMINGTKSEMALNMVVQVRNKVVDAYNEIMRMQV